MLDEDFLTSNVLRIHLISENSHPEYLQKMSYTFQPKTYPIFLSTTRLEFLKSYCKCKIICLKYCKKRFHLQKQYSYDSSCLKH